MTDTGSSPKLRVALLYGGRSTEHEISLESATSVLRNLDRSRYEVVPVYIDQQGAFHRQALLPAADEPLALPTNSSSAAEALTVRGGQLFAASSGESIDVVLPILHGPLCEDGSLQGLLELADVPYVGSRVLGSALCMDKEVAKRLVRAEGIPVVPYLVVRGPDFEQNSVAWHERIERELGYPAFVKPATLGSSVGVSKVKNRAELSAAIALALRFDDKLLVEKAIRAREIEYAVLAAEQLGAPPDVSVPGEIVAREDFYSFERKYLDALGADVTIPAAIDGTLAEQGRDAARKIFLTLECDGLARVDFFLDRDSGVLYFNEVNSLPGFTSISMYPKLWAASGVGYSELLNR
ncbi:MAG TPA: D-alanine--D-alanine ligase family protein, partial [Polyangiales bacterium]|nr:D-alanine--D-alanine ligase family protein [Polyangiales bacterium]